MHRMKPASPTVVTDPLTTSLILCHEHLILNSVHWLFMPRTPLDLDPHVKYTTASIPAPTFLRVALCAAHTPARAFSFLTVGSVILEMSDCQL